MIQPLFLGSIGMPELIIIFIIVLLLFGAKKIPELMNGLGKGVKSFKKGMKEVEDEIEKIDTDISDESKK
jgi:twin arginine-targeting protein translocase, TatA/E family